MISQKKKKGCIRLTQALNAFKSSWYVSRSVSSADTAGSAVKQKSHHGHQQAWLSILHQHRYLCRLPYQVMDVLQKLKQMCIEIQEQAKEVLRGLYFEVCVLWLGPRCCLADNIQTKQMI